MSRRQFYWLQYTVVLLAIFLILLASTGSDGLFAFALQPTKLGFYPQMVVTMLVAAGPDLLLMALGAYQLKQTNYSFARLVRYIITIIGGITLFSLIYYVYGLATTQQLHHFNSATFFSELVQGPFSTYDTLYGIIAFFVTLPILRVVAKHADAMTIKYLVIVELIFVGVFPVVGYLFGLSSIYINLPVALQGGAFFPLMGYWLVHTDFVRKITREQLLIAWILSLVCYTIMIAVTLYQSVLEGDFGVIAMQNFTQTFQAIPCLTFFITIETFILNRPLSTKHRLRPTNFLRLSYGVLLITGVVLAPLKVILMDLTPYLGPFIGSLIWVLTTILISYLVAMVLSHIAGITKLFPSIFMDFTEAHNNEIKDSMD
ncbi:polysaccharide biosynthesis protein [Lactobacillus sp. CBA3605]|uniref:polysaccharide biosynthesis protein n=1 Tax=Lactobacillus sp. CBA3605 TaxID=2099788 RepID=UPI000CFBC178|nr:polysaccharide biosynthesis protein [Lactobacillus sp. CBA3605]AVK62250.1 polysaccharide biosynthesis protein [Lactobacillus sp. CBA3605]